MTKTPIERSSIVSWDFESSGSGAGLRIEMIGLKVDRDTLYDPYQRARYLTFHGEGTVPDVAERFVAWSGRAEFVTANPDTTCDKVIEQCDGPLVRNSLGGDYDKHATAAVRAKHMLEALCASKAPARTA